VQALLHSARASNRPQAIIAIEQSKMPLFPYHRKSRHGVDTTALQTPHGIVEAPDGKGVESGGLPQGAFQSHRRGTLRIFKREADAPEDRHIEVVQYRWGYAL
jgi:hypothetical protein